ncbi:MAG: sporulation protein YqfD [Bacillota bacterium]
MLLKLLYIIQGYVTIEVRGYGKEKLINYLMRSDFEVWDIIHCQDRFEVKLKMATFRQIRSYVHQADCQVAIKSKHGLPALWKKVNRRRSLLVGIIFVIISLYFAASFIWLVEIEGLDEISTEEIKNLLAESGFKRGILKQQVQIEKMEKLLRQHKQVAWADVEINGTKLLVEVVEKKVIESDDKSTQVVDVVADKAGLIKELIILQGTAAVEEGELIQQGEKLISGLSKYYPQQVPEDKLSTEEQEELEPEIERTVAQGIVKAKVWYRSYGEARLVDYQHQSTAKVVDSVSIRYRDRELKVYGPNQPPFANFKVEKTVKSLARWRNIDFPIEVIRRRYINLKEIEEKLSFSEAVELAKEQALQKVIARLDKTAVIKEREFEVISKQQTVNNIVRVKGLITTEERIGVQKLRKSN